VRLGCGGAGAGPRASLRPSFVCMDGARGGGMPTLSPSVSPESSPSTTCPVEHGKSIRASGEHGGHASTALTIGCKKYTGQTIGTHLQALEHRICRFPRILWMTRAAGFSSCPLVATSYSSCQHLPSQRRQDFDSMILLLFFFYVVEELQHHPHHRLHFGSILEQFFEGRFAFSS
jgi:hypothetical protein